jgi:hypothetical protein
MTVSHILTDGYPGMGCRPLGRYLPVESPGCPVQERPEGFPTDRANRSETIDGLCLFLIEARWPTQKEYERI